MKRIKDGDFTGGIIDLVSGMLSLTGVGYPLALALDLFNAYGDISEGKAEKAGKMNWKMKMNDWFSKNLRNLPLFGTFIHLGEALGHIVSGNFLDGVESLLHMLAVTGGVGVGAMVYSWLTEKADENPEGVIAKTMNFGGMIKSWIMDNARNLPITGFAIRMGEAFGHLFNGDIIKGLKGMAGAIGVNFGLTQLIEWLSSDEDVISEGEGEATPIQKKGIMQTIKEMILDKFTKIWESLPSYIKWMAARVLPDSIVESLNGKKVDEEKEIEGEGTVEEQTVSKVKNIQKRKNLSENPKRDIETIQFKQKVTEEQINKVYSDSAGFTTEDRQKIIENNKDMIVSTL